MSNLAVDAWAESRDAAQTSTAAEIVFNIVGGPSNKDGVGGIFSYRGDELRGSSARFAAEATADSPWEWHTRKTRGFEYP
jgi:hypothetical protein